MVGADAERLDFVLLHSPLVGPPSVAPLADQLRRRGHTVVLPDLTGVVREPRPAWMIDAAVASVGATAVDLVLAHSGAGAILPVVARAVAARAMIFLDAVLPDPTATHHLPDDAMRDLLSEQAGPHGRLRPWLDWWSPDVVAALLPDIDDRRRVADACTRLPASFYEHPVPLPSSWVPGAYLALGGAYPDELGRAADLGWPCRSLGLTHLATVTHAGHVADGVLELGRAVLDPAPDR